MPDTDMKENELTIEIPNGKIVDWEESKKQNKIVLKDKQLTYEDVCDKLFENCVYYIDTHGEIYLSVSACIDDSNNASNKNQLECILAKNKLANVAMFLNNGWQPTNANKDFGWFVCYNDNTNEFEFAEAKQHIFDNNVFFKYKELAQQAIEILGEETVKLALKPLGI